MTLYFVINARVPSKKAYGIHIAKMSEAFARSGINVVLVIPRTRASQASLESFHQLGVSIRRVRIPVPDWYSAGRIGFFMSSFLFMVFSLVYLRLVSRRTRSVVYTADMDTFSFGLLPYAGLPVFAEMHDWRGDTLVTRTFFKQVRGIIATNTETSSRLASAFSLAPEALLVEANGVDAAWLQNIQEKDEARAALGIPLAAHIALYLGRFYDWKGLDILIDAARASSDILWYAVGGSEKEFTAATMRNDIPPNLIIPGESSFRNVPVWMSAADALLIIGTKGNSQSWQHTSPMKVYEYMARHRPIVASRTPALTSIMSADEAIFVEADNPSALVEGVRTALTGGNTMRSMLERDAITARSHTWDARAARIKAFIEAVSA